MFKPEISRRSFMKTAAALGVIASVRPAKDALAEVLIPSGRQETQWITGNKLNYRRDGLAKVTGQKVFAIDLRARDMQGWPAQQSHALTLHVPRADRPYLGLDLSVLGSDYQPDVLIDAESVEADGLRMPEPSFYGEFFLKKGQLSPMLGHPVALAIWHDYEKFRVANARLRFNDAIFRFGEETAQPARKPYVAARFVRVQGEDAYGEDKFSPMKNTTIWPDLDEQGVHWPGHDHPAFGALMPESERIQNEMKQPRDGMRVFSRKYYSQSVEHVAMEPENGLAWYNTNGATLHMVGATQAPYATAEHIMHMVKDSKLPLNKLDFITAYTVGYGQKEHHPFPYYVVLAALYAQGRPVRLALDRWKHFQFALKRHPFDTDAAISVDKDGKFRHFSCHMVGDGGGVQNFSPSVGTVAVTAAQSVYYFPESDLSTQVNPSIGVTSGSMRGYGTVQSMAYIEMLVDEIAQEIGLDPIELRQRNVLKSGMKNTQGASPAGHLRIGEILGLAAKEALWVERAKRKAEYEAANPGMLYGVGFGASQKDFGTGAEACIAQIEISPEGRLKMRHIANEIGTGSTTSQLVTVESILEMAVSTGTGKVQLLSHKTWLECGTPIVPELISGQMQGGVVMGIGHALWPLRRMPQPAYRHHLRHRPLARSRRQRDRRRLRAAAHARGHEPARLDQGTSGAILPHRPVPAGLDDLPHVPCAGTLDLAHARRGRPRHDRLPYAEPADAWPQGRACTGTSAAQRQWRTPVPRPVCRLPRSPG